MPTKRLQRSSLLPFSITCWIDWSCLLSLSEAEIGNGRPPELLRSHETLRRVNIAIHICIQLCPDSIESPALWKKDISLSRHS
jgi:hypothetical protein